MKGLLEGLGYTAAERRDDADLILFNTCTIRGQRRRALPRATWATPSGSSASGPTRWWPSAAAGRRARRRQVFREFPFVDIAFGPGEVSPAGRAAGARAPGRGGRVQLRRRLQRQPAGACASGRTRRGCRSRSAATASAPTASCRASAGGSAAGRSADVVGEVAAPGRRRRARGDAAGPERELLRARPAPRGAGDLRRASAGGGRRRRASGACATPAPTPRTCAPT